MPAWRPVAGGVSIGLRVTPNAGADRIEGVETLADGRQVLRLRVAAVADRGKANAAALALLARVIGLPKSHLTLAAGETSRLKTVIARGDAGEITGRLEALKPAEIRGVGGD